MPRTLATLCSAAIVAAAFAGAGFGGQRDPVADPTGFAGNGAHRGPVHALWQEPDGPAGGLRRVACAIPTTDSCYTLSRR